MKHSIVGVVVFVLVASVASAATPRYTGHIKAVPAGTDLVAYPILVENPDGDDQIKMKLALREMDREVQMHNFNRARGAFELDLLKVGDRVYMNEAGVPIYKASCGNRLQPFPTCPECPPPVPGPGVGSGQGEEPPPPPAAQGSWLSAFARGIWRALVSTLAILLALAILALAVALLAAFVGQLVNFVRQNWQRPPAPPPAPAPNPVPAPAPIPAPAPAPVPVPQPPNEPMIAAGEVDEDGTITVTIPPNIRRFTVIRRADGSVSVRLFPRR